MTHWTDFDPEEAASDDEDFEVECYLCGSYFDPNDSSWICPECGIQN